jgi:hypothetical protein
MSKECLDHAYAMEYIGDHVFPSYTTENYFGNSDGWK